MTPKRDDYDEGYRDGRDSTLPLAEAVLTLNSTVRDLLAIVASVDRRVAALEERTGA